MFFQSFIFYYNYLSYGFCIERKLYSLINNFVYTVPYLIFGIINGVLKSAFCEMSPIWNEKQKPQKMTKWTEDAAVLNNLLMKTNGLLYALCYICCAVYSGQPERRPSWAILTECVFVFSLPPQRRWAPLCRYDCDGQLLAGYGACGLTSCWKIQVSGFLLQPQSISGATSASSP